MPHMTTPDLQIYYEEAGTGTPLILVMGLGGDIQGWSNQIDALAANYRVITFDNRGAGRTSAPDKPYSIEGMARDLQHLMDHLEIESAHVVGLSMGGYIAQQFVLDNPKRVQKLVLMNTAANIDGYGREVVTTWMAVRQSSISREEWARFRGVFIYSPELLDDARRYRLAVANALANPYPQQEHAFLRQARAILDYDVADRLGEIQQQTLVISSEHDILVPLRNSELIASKIPNAQLITLPGGHVGAMEYPKDYNAAIIDFLGA